MCKSVLSSRFKPEGSEVVGDIESDSMDDVFYCIYQKGSVTDGPESSDKVWKFYKEQI